MPAPPKTCTTRYLRSEVHLIFLHTYDRLHLADGFAFPAKPFDQAIFDRADRRVHSLFLEATTFHHFMSD
ncbi:hypothetical protein BK652_03150 [Pseudomonas brassicacearum]|uniref:Uncharacterized protein n=1 Tax=Pseudomonas brassicacearum TaxID=930166 RepID=A0A423GHB9_9PSED|nr:hypothetical protein BK652_03150 [Pseudomonas brassicacearum]